MKIITYILYIHENVSTILFWENPIGELGYVIISFQSYRISFYIKIPCRFLPFTYLHYKTAVSR